MASQPTSDLNLVPRVTKAGIEVGGPFSWQRNVTIINAIDRAYHQNNYVIHLGAYGWTRVRVYADHLDAAIEIVGEWCLDHAPGHIIAHDSDEWQELLEEAHRELFPEIAFEKGKLTWTEENSERLDRAYELASQDLTYTESGFIRSWEWGIALENPTREQFLAYVRGE